MHTHSWAHMSTYAHQYKHECGCTKTLTHLHKDAQTRMPICVNIHTRAHSLSRSCTPMHTARTQSQLHTRAQEAHTCAPIHLCKRSSARSLCRPGWDAGPSSGGGGGTALWGKAAVRQPRGSGSGEPGMGRRLSPQEIDSSGLIVCLGTPVRMPPRKLNNSCPPL